MDDFVFGRKRHKIQWRADLPIVVTVICVVALFYGAVKLVSAYVRPEEDPVSTITVTKNTPSASELNLNAPLVDYTPNKDKEEEEEDSEEEEEGDDEEAEDSEGGEGPEGSEGESDDLGGESEGLEVAREGEGAREADNSGAEQTEVLGEQEETQSLGEIFSEVVRE